MKANRFLVVCAMVLALPALVMQGFASESGKAQKDTPKKVSKTLEQVDFVPNTLEAFLNNNGVYFENTSTGGDGMFWPAHSNHNVVFAAGPWLVGLSKLNNRLHSASSDYSTEYQPGPIVTTYDGNPSDAAADAANTGDSKWNIMILSKSTPPTDATYQEWVQNAAQTGAPLTPDGKPLLLGDLNAYWVMNDLTIAGHSAVSTTDPMGVEVHNYVFAFNQSGPLGQTMFIRMTFINKSTVEYDSCFTAWFSDIDLGDANDDMDGCDTTRSLGYVWNANNTDAILGSPAPADGYVFFEGPKVKTGNPADSAISGGVWEHGYKNRPMTSYAKFVNAAGIYLDPPLGGHDWPRQAYNLLNGLIGSTGGPFIDPTTGLPSKFFGSGDPVTGTGWLDPTAADKRLVMGSGPFDLLPGDTQEVVVGFVIGQGASNTNSVAVLRSVCDLAQLAFNVNFALASPPLAPKMAVGQLDNKLVLTWDNSAESYIAKDTLHQVSGHASEYTFEGYNLFQVDGPSYGPTSKAIRLATYDLVDGITKIWDYVANPALGENIYQPVEFGTDNGIKHYYATNEDAFTGGPLVNGIPYYFAVTAYGYNPHGSPVTLETPIGAALQTWIPNSVAAGTVVGATDGTTGVCSNRPEDDAFYYQVVNPDSLNGHTFQLSIDSAGPKWSLHDLTTNSVAQYFGTPVVDQPGTGTTYPYPIVDGVEPVLISLTPGLRRDTQTPTGFAYTGKQWFTAPEVANGFEAFAAPSGSGYAVTWAGDPAIDNAALTSIGAVAVSADSLPRVKIIFSNTNISRVYRYVDSWKQNVAALKAKDSSFLPYLLNSGTSFPYQDFEKYPLGNQSSGISAPFTVWTADTDDHGRQLNVGLLEHNDSLQWFPFTKRGGVNGKWAPDSSINGGGDIILIFKSTYSETADPRYTGTAGNPLALKTALQSGQIDLLYCVWLRADGKGNTFKNGDTLTITPNYMLATGRKYVFTIPKTIIGSDSVAKKRDDISKVQVFPNPYFAYNPLETNQFVHFVTFTHLPKICTIKIFSLNGVLIRTISHVDATGGNPAERWDLTNSSGLPVASGMYIAYIDGGSVGTKILKLAIIQSQQRVNKL